MQIFQKLTFSQKSYLINPLISSEKSFKYLLGSCQAHGDRQRFSKNSNFGLKTQTFLLATNTVFFLEGHVPFTEKRLPNTHLNNLCLSTPLSSKNVLPGKAARAACSPVSSGPFLEAHPARAHREATRTWARRAAQNTSSAACAQDHKVIKLTIFTTSSRAFSRTGFWCFVFVFVFLFFVFVLLQVLQCQQLLPTPASPPLVHMSTQGRRKRQWQVTFQCYDKDNLTDPLRSSGQALRTAALSTSRHLMNHVITIPDFSSARKASRMNNIFKLYILKTHL